MGDDRRDFDQLHNCKEDAIPKLRVRMTTLDVGVSCTGGLAPVLVVMI